MPPKVDPEFAKAFEPFAQLIASAPKPPVGDIESRAKGMAALVSMAPQQPMAQGVESNDHWIDSSDGVSIRLQHLSPVSGQQESQLKPCIVHFHGGGYIAGATEMITPYLSFLVAATGVQLFSVDYRLVPAHQHPTPAEDGYAALEWVSQNATTFNIDPARIAVMGDSAGGGLAACVALLARDRNLQPPLAKQILIYPMLDDRSERDLSSVSQYVICHNDDNKTAWKALLGDKYGTDQVSPYAAPSRVDNVQGLPSTYMDIGSLDLFLEAGLHYVSRLAAANINTELHVYPGIPHAWEAMVPGVPVSFRAFENRKRAILEL
ncbi:Carboxylesterase NlhH 1 [Stagonosporopsis vannaccii]|nr:Carboxylesterase NlhH 1 [Stagonosporopsis vannaccii]